MFRGVSVSQSQFQPHEDTSKRISGGAGGAQRDDGLEKIRKPFFCLEGRCLAPQDPVKYKGGQIKTLCNQEHYPKMGQAGLWGRAR